MVFRGRNFVGQSFDSAAKGFTKSLALIFLIAVGACSSNPPQPSNVATSVQSLSASSGLKLTSIGINHSATFSPDGKKILFVSRQRQAHSQSQIYLLDLENFRERRITFQDGDCADPLFSSDGKSILFSSTTDELKERPRLLNPTRGVRPPSDLYWMDLNGQKIERLTQSPGYDGSMSWVNASSFLFNREIAQGTEIRMGHLNGSDSHWLKDSKASLEKPTLDPTGSRIAWLIREPNSDLKLGLKLKGRVQKTEIPFVEINNLQWIQGPQKNWVLLMSAQKRGDSIHKAWIWDFENQCTQLVFEETGSLFEVHANSKMEKLLYRFGAAENSQIYMREFPQLLGACEPINGPKPAESPASKSPAADPSEHPKTQ